MRIMPVSADGKKRTSRNRGRIRLIGKKTIIAEGCK